MNEYPNDIFCLMNKAFIFCLFDHWFNKHLLLYNNITSFLDKITVAPLIYPQTDNNKELHQNLVDYGQKNTPSAEHLFQDSENCNALDLKCVWLESNWFQFTIIADRRF